jgi:hypothetical protein
MNLTGVIVILGTISLFAFSILLKTTALKVCDNT